MTRYGRDPYNHNPEIARRVEGQRMLRAMEYAWKACVRQPTPQPDMIYVSGTFAEMLHDVLTRPPVEGREFFPYG